MILLTSGCYEVYTAKGKKFMSFNEAIKYSEDKAHLNNLLKQAEYSSDYEYRIIYLKLNPDLEPKVRSAIEDCKIYIGMRKEDVRASWGGPTRVNRTVERYGIHEQWVYCKYGDCLSGAIYVYFDDGILTSWQD
jgi:hypothetical protein